MASVVVLKINFVEPLEWGTFLTVPAGVWWEMQEPLGIFPDILWLFLNLYLQRKSHFRSVCKWGCFVFVFGLCSFLLCGASNNWFHGSWYLSLSPLPFFLVCSSLEWSMVCFLALPWLLSVHSYINMSVLRENMFSHSLPLKWFKNWYKILANNHTIQTEYDYY